MEAVLSFAGLGKICRPYWDKAQFVKCGWKKADRKEGMTAVGRKRGDTKERIMQEALKLFSVNGFDAVSIRTIAEAVGIGNSALYKHFSSKQEILEAIVEYSKAYFIKVGCEQMAGDKDMQALKDSCLKMFAFQTRDEWIVMFRRLLMIEQFKNPKMAEIYQSFFIELPVQSQEQLFLKLMEAGIMKKKNARVLAMELYAPFFLYHTAAERREDILELLQCHVQNFYEENMVERQDK